MKVLFLDFDGVLNGREWLNRTQNIEPGRYWRDPCDPALVAHLNAIVARTGAKVVISSTWRRHHRRAELRAFLQQAGFAHPRAFIDVTPYLPGKHRGQEIQAWLDANQDVLEFVILDDDSDMDHLAQRLVQTPNATGLRAEHVARAIELLGEALVAVAR